MIGCATKHSSLSAEIEKRTSIVAHHHHHHHHQAILGVQLFVVLLRYQARATPLPLAVPNKGARG